MRNIKVARECWFEIIFYFQSMSVKWDASLRWSSSLFCLMRNSDEMTIGKMHPTLESNYLDPYCGCYRYMHCQCSIGNPDKLHHVCFRAPLIGFFEFFENAEIDFTKVTLFTGLKSLFFVDWQPRWYSFSISLGEIIITSKWCHWWKTLFQWRKIWSNKMEYWCIFQIIGKKSWKRWF